MVLLSDTHPIDLTIGQELPPTFHYAWVILQFDFSRLSAGEIDRVEVVRGAQSALYGSDAIGSVVQIFTKRGQPTDAPQLSGSFEGGSFGTARGDAWLLGGAGQRLDY